MGCLSEFSDSSTIKHPCSTLDIRAEALNGPSSSRHAEVRLFQAERDRKMGTLKVKGLGYLDLAQRLQSSGDSSGTTSNYPPEQKDDWSETISSTVTVSIYKPTS